jgi:hypothetical protein
MDGELASERPRTSDYYDRRAFKGTRTVGHAVAYWRGLGVEATTSETEVEAGEVCRLLARMSPSRFVEVGAGPGTFTPYLPGWGVALDQARKPAKASRSPPRKPGS